ncbi:hypothetical protein PHOBOS_1 [Erwinia phage vB_EamM_Phobos]|uniref:hypothetical protein n=1 Tax=Erwinia phage vB_EamM_Phobos TaxID=1883377 RepID=UPI00081C41FA|nr:hypothetical protein BIZ79_gp001 [Erwinia phage vB_EamM_Phobos]ANZ50191.1 hypothetical protein PHOBOS_1 [Erwinia phage vB_EamM_Phobos]
MKTKIIIKGMEVEADEMVGTSAGNMDDKLADAIRNQLDNHPDMKINSIIIATSKSIAKDDPTPLMSTSFWFSEEVLVIGDVGSLLFGGIIPLSTNGIPVSYGSGEISNHVILWKRDSYINCYDLKLDSMYRELICNYFRTLINNTLSITE